MADDPSEIDELLRELTGDGRPAREDGPSDSEPMAEPTPPAPTPGAGPQPDRAAPLAPDRRNLIVIAAIVIVALMGMAGLVGWLLGGRQATSTDAADLVVTDSTTGSTGAEGDESGIDDGDDATGGPDTFPGTPTSDTTVDTTVPSSPSTSGEPFVASTTPDNPYGASQYLVVAQGTAYFRGWYPTRESVDDMLATAAQLMGPENVVDETVIDPRAEIDSDNFRVYYDDPVLFERNSARIANDFLPLLEATAVAMLQDPTLTVTVVARTDARGAASYNLSLSEWRAQAVADYWISRGVDPDRITLDPRGEEDATPRADDRTAALERRVELIVKGSPVGG